jgi:hypothetical protein
MLYGLDEARLHDWMTGLLDDTGLLDYAGLLDGDPTKITLRQLYYSKALDYSME